MLKKSLILGFIVIATCVLAGTALARTGVWTNVPSYGTARAQAIIDQMGSPATGRVAFNAGGHCRRVQYRPYAIASGSWSTWNNLTTYCDNVNRTISWSDRYHLSYNGYKFRICGVQGCGDELRIAF